MFEVDNYKIGSYLSGLIKSSERFKSARDFCRQWLKLEGVDTNEDNIRKAANRLSQIKNGFKGIRTYDLPAFSELLGVSIEQILSAGEFGAADAVRKTNYYIAQSQNKEEWEEYIAREDKPFLCKDEFGKNIIEYAIQFNNYNFIKYLIDKEYIWFDSKKDNDYVMTFGANTKIKYEDRSIIPENDDLSYKLSTQDLFRLNIISLAVENGDYKMLDKLRARELPELYYKANYLSCAHPDFDSHYDKKAVSRIAESKNTDILEYFTDRFKVRDPIKYKKGESQRYNTFVYPFISQLIDFLISNESRFANRALEKMIEHNKWVLKEINDLIDDSVKNGWYTEDDWKKEYDFYDNGNIVSFRDTFAVKGMITNVVHATKTSKKDDTNKLIKELNRTYNKIKNLKEEKK
jgi:hypothetical protein